MLDGVVAFERAVAEDASGVHPTTNMKGRTGVSYELSAIPVGGAHTLYGGPMQYRRLGHTGMTVSRICLGCMSYGSSKWRPWGLNEGAARPFFCQAIERGINFFDTADMYSLGVSEEVTGRALRAMAKLEEIVIATKVFWPMSEGQNMSGLSRKHIMQACEASLRRLGIETIDLYQVH